MLVVSDTTPIISLMKVNQLDILKVLFNQIIIPKAVYDELTVNPDFLEEASLIRNCDFIKTVTIEDRKLIADEYKGDWNTWDP